jgi:hypothetical protein
MVAAPCTGRSGSRPVVDRAGARRVAGHRETRYQSRPVPAEAIRVFQAKKADAAAIPVPVKAGRILSSLVFVAYPFLLLAGAMSLGSASQGLLSVCTGSWFGAFLCTGVFYPLVFLVGYIASRVALGRGKVGLAAAFAWFPLLALVLTALPAGVIEEFL